MFPRSLFSQGTSVMQLAWQWRQHWQVPGRLKKFSLKLLRWNLNPISPALIFSLNRQSMINGQITCREGHSSWWGRARDWGGKPLQQTLPHAKDLGSSKLKKMVIVLRWTTTQVLLAALMWLELLCLWLFPGCQIDVLKAFALNIWLFLFKNWEPLHCGLISGGRVMFLCLLGCCSHPWWFN